MLRATTAYNGQRYMYILMSEYRILGIQRVAANITRTLCGLRLYIGLRYRLFDFAIFTGTPATRGMLHNPTR